MLHSLFALYLFMFAMYLQFSRSSANNDQTRSMLYYYCKTRRLLCAASKVTKPSRRRKTRRGRSAAAPKATSQGTAKASPAVAVVLKDSQKTLDSQMDAADYNKNAEGGPNTFIGFVKQLAVSRFGRIVMLGVYSIFGAILFVTVEGAKQEDVVVTAEATIS